MYYLVKIQMVADASVDQYTVCDVKQLKKLIASINQNSYDVVEVKAIEGSYVRDYKEFIDKNEKLNTGDIGD